MQNNPRPLENLRDVFVALAYHLKVTPDVVKTTQDQLDFDGKANFHIQHWYVYATKIEMTDAPSIVQRDAYRVIQALQDYIQAIPADVHAALPAMPGVDYAWVDQVKERLKGI